MLKPAFAPWALIPAKRFNRAKTRLSPVLDAAARRELARALFERVLRAATESAELAGVLVATDGDDAAQLAARYGAHTLRDAEATQLAGIVDAGIAWLAKRGATHALVLMSDLPLIERRDIRELLAAAREHRLVLAPDNARRGTNAFALALDSDFATSFGTRDSLNRHVDAALRAGTPARVLVHPRLGFDLDSPSELRRWRAMRA